MKAKILVGDPDEDGRMLSNQIFKKVRCEDVN
jgi:hypothetical protein